MIARVTRRPEPWFLAALRRNPEIAVGIATAGGFLAIAIFLAKGWV